MKTILMIATGLVLAGQLKAETMAMTDSPCLGKTIYFQTYNSNADEFLQILNSGILENLKNGGAIIKTVENQSDQDRRIAMGKGYSKYRPSIPKHQIDFNSESESDLACAESLRAEFSTKANFPRYPQRLHPTSLQKENHIVFWWMGRMLPNY